MDLTLSPLVAVLGEVVLQRPHVLQRPAPAPAPPAVVVLVVTLAHRLAGERVVLAPHLLALQIFFRYVDIYEYVSTAHLDHALVLHVAEWFVLLLVAWLGAVSGLGLVPAEGGRRHGHGRGPAGGTRAGPARAAPSSAILGLARRYYFRQIDR